MKLHKTIITDRETGETTEKVTFLKNTPSKNVTNHYMIFIK